MRDAGGKRAEGDQRHTLPRDRFHRPGGVIQPADQVRAERKPCIGSIAKRSRRHLENSTLDGSPARGEVGAVLVPGTEAARPTTWHIHPRDHRVFATDTADEIDSAIDEHPPEVRGLALPEHLDAGLDLHLDTVGDQIGKLIIGKAVKYAQGAKIVNTHQIVAR